VGYLLPRRLRFAPSLRVERPHGQSYFLFGPRTKNASPLLAPPRLPASLLISRSRQMKKLLVGLALGLGTMGVVTVGRGVAPADAAAAESMAMQLSRVVMSPDGYKELIKQSTGGIIAGIKSQGQELPKDFAKKMEAVVAEALPYQELLAFNSQVYGSRFSDKELQDLITFYKTPTGAKLVRLLPAISGEVGQKLGLLLPQRLPALMKKHGLTP
jgi:uncharacterized protein